jgi:hypothetical protein
MWILICPDIDDPIYVIQQCILYICRWFHDIGRSNAANAELIELIFQVRTLLFSPLNIYKSLSLFFFFLFFYIFLFVIEWLLARSKKLMCNYMYRFSHSQILHKLVNLINQFIYELNSLS